MYGLEKILETKKSFLETKKKNLTTPYIQLEYRVYIKIYGRDSDLLVYCVNIIKLNKEAV